MELSKKVLAVIIVIAVGFTVFGMAVWQNIGGLGDALSGVGGPISNGFYNIFIAPINWAAGGGWPTLGIFLLITYIIIPCVVAYAVWHYDIPYKVTGVTAPQTGVEAGYSNTMNREPPEPERAPTPS